jgi:dTDP-4-dehydrorhamnose reductase
MEMLLVNVLLPQTVARVCSMTNIPWAHVSSGSIYRGATVSENGELRLESDLSLPALRRLFASQPRHFRGFTEMDEPNCSFKFAPCSFYSGTKALAEETIREHREGYIWRFRLPFNHHDGPRNFLTRLSNLDHVCDAINCLSQVDDAVNACLELWERRAPFGIYNVINPGGITTGEVIEMVQRILKPPRRLNLLVYEHQTSSAAGRTTHFGCLLDSSKLHAHGIRLRDVHEAIDQSLKNWQPRASQAVSISA